VVDFDQELIKLLQRLDGMAGGDAVSWSRPSSPTHLALHDIELIRAIRCIIGVRARQ
jgi:hypothetical protein